jgi:hypothetical protein
MRQFFAKYVSWEALRPQLLALYTDTFTESELRELIAFYKTPVGQKSIEVMPGLFQKGIDIGQKLVQDHLGELREAVRKKLEENAKKP